MASQNYSAKVLGKIDERFVKEAVTGDVVNKGGIRLEFNGNNSVTIYNVDVVQETDYVRSGSNRFGTLVELGNGVQTFVLSQDKSFTFSVDRGNLEDAEMVNEANKAVKRQIREVSIPNTDIYRLAVAASYAIANGQKNTTGTPLSNTNSYASFLAQNDAMTDAKVPETGRVAFISPTRYSLMKRDPEFSKACDNSYNDLKKGIIGTVDGVTFKKVPSSYLPANVGFLLLHDATLIAPVKFNSTRVLTEQRGIDGAVAEGRRYHDCFIPKNKGVGIRVHMEA